MAETFQSWGRPTLTCVNYVHIVHIDGFRLGIGNAARCRPHPPTNMSAFRWSGGNSASAARKSGHSV